jgi:hypothetical protein
MKYQRYNASVSSLSSGGHHKGAGKMCWYYELRILGSLDERLWLTTGSSAYNMWSVLREFRFQDKLSYLLAIS